MRWAIYLVTLLLLTGLYLDGFSYYTAPYAERPHHPDYRALRPAGTQGLLWGYLGTAFMLLMQLYSVRKRTRLLGRRIPLAAMLRLHIYLGIAGPLFIVLHTSFKVQGLVAVSFWSMAAVAGSGFFGRYLYTRIPRNIAGDELSMRELEEQYAELGRELRGRFRLDDEVVEYLEGLGRSGTPAAGGQRGGIGSLLRADLFRPWLRRRLRRELGRRLPLPRRELGELAQLAGARARLGQRILALGRLQRLFHYWHVVHKPFAFVMYLIMLVHIGVAVWTGYAWVW